ncbi:uncharacterized protein LOC130922736 [Corythoichthys intestinalis]|uniref:uncharacterized protein LOC130922736 n=1 Tax=Corythoichthys intestinalis TaxID=161448 RepID=UPI0025A59D7D|nr:uncharacterized protein LOC130922736 [Corythoichthys intestinalis]XP_057703687.1 uncharacterized protein LOC130922736 [Corythoichthys intestinalis]
MAKISGKSFENILREGLTRITEVIGESNEEPADVEGHEPDTSRTISSEVNENIAPATVTSESNRKLPSEQIIPPEVQRLVVEHIVKTPDTSSQSISTARLRPFSGRMPCPNFEVDYDTWRDSVEFYLADSTISDRQIVRKIVDSLSSPAASVVKSLGPHSSSRAYLELLDAAFATVEDSDELFAKFLSLNQNAGEAASNYLQRLQNVLNKSVQMKAISVIDADKQLLKQFCRGCWDNDLIRQLQLESKVKDPPSFSELLWLLRTEEDKQATKATRMKQHLGFTKPKAQTQAHNISFCDKTDSISTAEMNKQPTELQKIQKQLVSLQSQIATLMQLKENKPTMNQGEKTKNKKPSDRKESSSVKQSPVKPSSVSKRPRPWYCFHCGEDGHIKTSCNNPPDPALVNAKRQELKAKQEAWEKSNAADNLNVAVSIEGQMGTEVKESPKTNTVHKSRISLKQHQTVQTRTIPKGLVGTKTAANIKVNGIECNSLLDTGSQVTTVSKSFYNLHLSDQIMHPISDILEVEGATGDLVSYAGYVQLNVQFPKEFIDCEPQIQTLALVVPDVRSNSDTPILIGTNTLDPLYEQYCDSIPSINPYCGYHQVLRILRFRQDQQDDQFGFVKLRSRKPDVIPAGQKVVLDGFVNVSGVSNEKWALLEQPTLSSLPGGIFIDSCLITLPACFPHKIPVVLNNETNRDISLPINCVVAKLSVPQKITDIQNVPLSQKCEGSSEEFAKPTNQQTYDTSGSLKFDFGDSPLPEEWKARIIKNLNTYSDVFSHDDLDFGHATKVKHRIQLKEDTPFKQRPRPIHPQDYNAVRRHLQTLLDAGVIRESESPFSSPIVVVKKKNGDIRLCVDYRKLNSQTIKDAYALPNLEESFSALNGSQWFSVMDLKSGYYQIEMEESDKAKTAFVCPLGFWEWNRMPQGITNAPSTFQRLMEKCMGDINLREVLVFLDDIIVFSKTLEEHEIRLAKVLERLRENGLKLSPEKCRFFQTSVRYLGHIVSRNGVETDPTKIEALKTWPKPQTLKELRSFLGFAGYYRRYVEGYSKITKPLTNLLTGYPPSRKMTKVYKNADQYHDPKGQFGERWTADCQNAFEDIIEKLTSSPVLGFANPEKPYVLHTDASTTGLGAALYQEQDGQNRVIAYASRGLSKSEARYPAHKLEFLALKWAVTEKFHDYLYGNTFTVVTDNNPLRYILTTAKLDATSYRWLANLSTYSFDIKYRAGKQNQDADGLSRRPHGELINDQISQDEIMRIRDFTSHHLVSEDVVKASCQHHTLVQEEELGQSPCFIESLALHPDAIPAAFEEDGEISDELFTFPKYSDAELARLQQADPVISTVIKSLESGDPVPDSLKLELPELCLMLRELPRLELKNGLLFKKRHCGNTIVYQFVLPRALRSSIFTSLHDEMGHLGIDRTLDLVRSRFYWPKMASEIELKIKTCARCVKRKKQPDKAAPLVSITTSRPMELVCMDFLSLEPDSHNTKDVLVITDHFTKYAVAIPTRDQKASTVARCLWEQFFIHYGFPERLLSDQGRDFESVLIKELCTLLGIKKIRTSPYHPRGNPVERYNRTLLSMLGTLQEKQKMKWRDYVKPLTHAYNCTKNDVTGFTPYELMFGRQPRLPIDIAFGLPVKEGSIPTHAQYVKNLKSYLKSSYQIATENANKVADKNKKTFDVRIRESTLEIGDRVLVRNVRLRGKNKLADRWESTIYVVQKRASDLPVYTVCPEGQDGPTRTLHRDLLLPCGFLPENEETLAKPKTTTKSRTRNDTQMDDDHQFHSLDEDEDEIQFCSPDIETVFHPVEPMVKLTIPTKDRLKPVPNLEKVPDVEMEKSIPVKQPNLSESINTQFQKSVVEENGHLSHDLAGECQSHSNDSKPNEENGIQTENPLTEMEENVFRIETEDLTNAKENEMGSKTDQVLVDNSFQSSAEFAEVTQESNPLPAEDTGESDQYSQQSLRRSVRQRKPPEKLTYSQLGKPFLSLIQTVFDGFNTALGEMFEERLRTEAHEGTHVI